MHDATCRCCADYREATKDLLGKLMLARDEETGKGFAMDRELRDQVLSLLIAGHEVSTSVTFSHYWYISMDETRGP